MENNPENINKIINRIRKECVKLNRTGSPEADRSALPACPDIDVPRFSPPSAFAIKDSYDLSDLLNFHDREFIEIAYRAVLHRLPDAGGINFFLDKLRSGRLTKVEIIGRLRYSPEGRENHIPISGLFFPFLLQSACKLYGIGRLIRIFAGLFNLPKILANIQITENALFAHHHEIRQKSDDLAGQLKRLRDHTAGLQNSTSAEVDTVRKKFNALVTRIEFMEKSLNFKAAPELDTLYADFEDIFRGTRADIRERLKVYLPYIAEAQRDTTGGEILDLGSGNGEWLELLKAEGYSVTGVDSNRILIDRCEQIGLAVIHGDLIEHLRTLPDSTLSAVTGFHILEHLHFYSVISLIDETRRVLKPGGRAIFETPNPENLTVGACSFYQDPTHHNPLVPGTLRFLFEQRGFASVEILRLHKYTDYFDVEHSNDISRQWLYNEMDYSVIGIKK